MVADCHAGESRFKSFKGHASTASGRDNEIHVARRENEAMAVQQMIDGQKWTASAYDRKQGTWTCATIQASDACIEFLKEVSEKASERRERGTGRPRGTRQWSVDLDADVSADGPLGAWQDVVVGILRKLGSTGLLKLYEKWFSCGRAHGNPDKCSNPRCCRCWNSRSGGLSLRNVDCSNVWTAAPPRVSAGTGTLRGASMVDAVEKRDGLLWVQGSLGADVELYYTREALAARKPGSVGTCTLGKVAFFFDHDGNTFPGGGRQGATTKWVAVSEYVTAGRRKTEQIDPPTGHPVMRLRKVLSFFPAEAIRQVVHFYHRCPENKCGPVSQSGNGNVWRHVYDSAGANLFLHNRHFRGPTPA